VLVSPLGRARPLIPRLAPLKALAPAPKLYFFFLLSTLGWSSAAGIIQLPKLGRGSPFSEGRTPAFQTFSFALRLLTLGLERLGFSVRSTPRFLFSPTDKGCGLSVQIPLGLCCVHSSSSRITGYLHIPRESINSPHVFCSQHLNPTSAHLSLKLLQ
jgi:hypothetical protein